MSFSTALKAALAPYHLLNHPFYQAWNAGSLSRETLRDYAEQYAHHVDMFPRYISATHSICDNLDARKLLTENLYDEELNGTDHPTLWRQFAKGMGATDDSINNAELADSTKALIDTLMTNGRASYAEGLCSLYTYEHQVPEIAETKIRGLKEFYNGDQPETLEFFTVHQGADVVHRQQCETLIDALPVADQPAAQAAALRSAKALWNFLSGIEARAAQRESMAGCGSACGCAAA